MSRSSLAGKRKRRATERGRARDLILVHGWNSTSYQLLNPGLELWFSRRGDGVVGFVRRGRTRIVAGAPVCAENRLQSITAEWERHAACAGDAVCYFAAGHRLESVLPQRAKVLLGAQPVWQPALWQAHIATHASLRAQLRRARNKGVEVQARPPEQAACDQELYRCLQDWLNTRGMPSLHFLVEPNVLAHLRDRRVWVATQEISDTTGSARNVVGFCVAAPVPARRGWLIEHIIRSAKAPNGTAELLVHTAMCDLAQSDAEYVTLGLTPLCQTLRGKVGTENPLWLRFVLGWIRAHGRRFYNFDGIQNFKGKFRPQMWEPIYAIASHDRFSPRLLFAIAGAFTGQPPLRWLARTALHALKQERKRRLHFSFTKSNRANSTPGRPQS